MDFESSGNYLKHVIICGCLCEVNPPVFMQPIEEYLTAIQCSILYLLRRPNPVFSLTPFSNYKVISSLFVFCEELGRKGSAQQNGREGGREGRGVFCSLTLFFFLHHAYHYQPLFSLQEH